MFFYNSDSDFLTAKEKNLYKIFKNSLDTEYKISFSFDQDVNEMTYLAIKKKEFEMKNSFPEVIIAKVDSLKGHHIHIVWSLILNVFCNLYQIRKKI